MPPIIAVFKTILSPFMLIEEFKRQTNDTILTFMSQLGQFIYATQNEIVLVYIGYIKEFGGYSNALIKKMHIHTLMDD